LKQPAWPVPPRAQAGIDTRYVHALRISL